MSTMHSKHKQARIQFCTGFIRCNKLKLESIPYSPFKQRAVVKILANSLSMTENIIINCQTSSDSLSLETKELVTEFYQQDDISRIAPGKCDSVTVITANGRKSFRKGICIWT